MTEVIFHTAVSDPLKHLVKLSLKALAQSQSIVILSTDTERLKVISDHMWAFEPSAFVPHCFWDAPESVRQRSKIFLTNHAQHPGLPTQSLIHWGNDMANGFASFERFVEIIGCDEASVNAGRQKWKSFQQMGYPLKHVALNAPK